MVYAAILHDEAKPFAKEICKSCNGLSRKHECASAYDSLFFDHKANKLYIAYLIQWQQILNLNEYKEMLGDKLFNDITLLKKCDFMAC